MIIFFGGLFFWRSFFWRAFFLEGIFWGTPCKCCGYKAYKSSIPFHLALCLFSEIVLLASKGGGFERWHLLSDRQSSTTRLSLSKSPQTNTSFLRFVLRNIYTLTQVRFANILNVVCCVGSVQIQIEIENGWCTADTDSKV